MNFENTGYDPEMSLWSSGLWGNGWASTPGGVARQLGLSGRQMSEFVRFVNAQKRNLLEQRTGESWGYNSKYSLDNMPSWIKQLYQTKGASGAAQATGKSGTGRYVNQAAYNNRGDLGIDRSGAGSGRTAGGQARQRGLEKRAMANYIRQLNAKRRQELAIQ